MRLVSVSDNTRMARTEQANEKWARRFNEEVWWPDDVDSIDHLVAADFVGYKPSLLGRTRGPEEVREVVTVPNSGHHFRQLHHTGKRCLRPCPGFVFILLHFSGQFVTDN